MQTQEGCHVGRDEFTQILPQSLSLFSCAKLDFCLCIYTHACDAEHQKPIPFLGFSSQNFPFN